MEKKDLRIVFMGTPEFAVDTLKALVENDYNVVAVVTQPDKPVGRHQTEMQPSEVKKYALEHNLPVLQPVKMKDPEFVEQLRSYNANLQVVVAFRMLPEVVWDMPEYGTFNVHAALLPQYRGAAPINWAVINGETQTGVTTFFLDHDIDTGRYPRRCRRGIRIRRIDASGCRNLLGDTRTYHRSRRTSREYSSGGDDFSRQRTICRSEDIQGDLRDKLGPACQEGLRLHSRSVALSWCMVHTGIARRQRDCAEDIQDQQNQPHQRRDTPHRHHRPQTMHKSSRRTADDRRTAVGRQKAHERTRLS